MRIELTSALLLLSDALAWGYRGGTGNHVTLLLRISNFLVFFLSDLMLFFFHGYLCCCLFPEFHLFKKSTGSNRNSAVPHRRIVAVYLISVSGMLMVVISQFTHLYYFIDVENYYHRNTGYFLSLLIPLAGMLLELSLLFQYRKHLRKELFWAMLSYLILPLLAVFFSSLYYGISFNNIAICIAVIFMFLESVMEQNYNLAMKEKEAAEMRIGIMISQIQPHFMYNSLNTIYHLCEKNPAQAREAICHFSEYLHHLLRSVNHTTAIPFWEEMEHVKNYLDLEKMRFAEDLRIVYDIQATDFLVPPLSIQPLAENAVKHGICGKEDGGTLLISSCETSDEFLVILSDDGAGFDPGEEKDDGKPHIGITNVRQRLAAMCHGTLEIESSSGKGTKVTVKIPKEADYSKNTAPEKYHRIRS